MSFNARASRINLFLALHNNALCATPVGPIGLTLKDVIRNRVELMRMKARARDVFLKLRRHACKEVDIGWSTAFHAGIAGVVAGKSKDFN